MNKDLEHNNLKNHCSGRSTSVLVFFAVFGVLPLTVSCNATPEDIAKMTGVEEMSLTLSSPFKFDPKTYDFGPQIAYTSSTDKTITITNSAPKPVFIDSLSGANSHFALTSDTCPRSPSSLDPNQSCTASVRFEPVAIGVQPMSLTIIFGPSSDKKDQSQSLELTGTGIQDKDSNSGGLSFSPSPHSFGSLVAGLGSVDKVIVISNSLSRDVFISSITGDKEPFSISSSDCPASSVALQSAKSCTVKVTFAPTSEGDFSMTLRVDFGLAAKGSELSANTTITGTGSSPSAVGNAALTFSPNSNDFGAVYAGSGTATKDIEVTNVAAIPIYIAAITKTNLNYSITTDTCPRTPTGLASGAKCIISTRFAPLTGGESSSNVKVAYGLSAGEDNFSATISLVGTGVGNLNFAGLETANPITTTDATLNWTHVAGATNYFVYRLADDGTASLAATITPPTATFTVTGLTPATSYTYFVKAMDQLGTQDSNSSLVTFSTKNLGTFTSISDLSVAEAATQQTAALSCSDSYGSAPTYTITSQSDSDSTCSLTAAPVKVSCTPAYKTGHSNWTSALSVECSLNGSTFTKSFTVTVTDTNRAPSLSSISNQTVVAGSAITTVNAGDGGDDFDADLDVLAYTCTFGGGGNADGTNCTSLPGTPAFDASTGELTWTPSYGAAVSASDTVYTFSITGSDQQSSPLTDNKSFTVTVTPATPTLTVISDQVFPSNYLDQGSTLNLDWNNIREGSPGNDTGVTYACVYDRVVDGAVSSGTNCSSLGGTVSFSTSAGTLSWTPDATIWGAYEIKVTGTNAAGSGDEYLTVNVRQAYVTTNLTADYDAQFANLTGPNSGTASGWSDLTSNAFDGTAAGNADAGWAGTGVYSSPYRNQFDGGGRIDFGTSPMASQTKMIFHSWVAPASVSTGNATIVGNSANATGNGFTVRQSTIQSGKMELVLGKSYRDVVLADNPVAYWRLGESSGTTATDISTIGANGTYTNSPILGVAGAIAESDTSVTFNGVDQYVSVASSPSFAAGFSVETWLRTPEPTKNFQMIAVGNGFQFRFYATSGKLSLCLGCSIDYVTNTTLTANTWHHVVATFDGTTIKYYFNGILDANEHNASGHTMPTSIANIGRRSDGYYFNGTIDDISFYNAVLSPAQVTAHYSAGLTAYGGICYTTSTFSNNTWNFIAGLFDGSTAKLFVNGRQECSIPVSAGFTAPATNLVAASTSTSSQANAWSGGLADLKVYTTSDGSSVGSSSDILTNFNATADRFRASPVSTSGIVTNGLVLNLDAANGDGLRYPGSGCSFTKWLDLSTSGLTGTLTNFASCGANSGWNGDGTTGDPYSLSFDGTDDFVVVPHSSALDLTTAWSIESWVLLRACSGGNAQIMTDEFSSIVQYSLGFANCTPRTGFYKGGWYTSVNSTAISTNTWYHLVGTYSGAAGEVKLYINGTLSQTVTGVPSTVGSNGNQKRIGRRWDSSDFINADIAKVAVYSIALSESEISQNCNALKSRFSGATCN